MLCKMTWNQLNDDSWGVCSSSLSVLFLSLKIPEELVMFSAWLYLFVEQQIHRCFCASESRLRGEKRKELRVLLSVIQSVLQSLLLSCFPSRFSSSVQRRSQNNIYDQYLRSCCILVDSATLSTFILTFSVSWVYQKGCSKYSSIAKTATFRDIKELIIREWHQNPLKKSSSWSRSIEFLGKGFFEIIVLLSRYSRMPFLVTVTVILCRWRVSCKSDS